ncbi:peptidyl-prolyl cis-trans isomerase [Croceiramulus getboli]|nr:peptidyl-prolyl cis-trans isomerase [Flavobacteriaceae bacterium YJPT1-3]
MKRILVVLLLFVLQLACTAKDERANAVARVNDSYLYKEDIANLVPPGTSARDSTLVVNGFITRWATQQLLMDGARRNLTQEQQDQFNSMVRQYRDELYTKAYKDAVVAQTLDSIVSDQEIAAYYEEHLSNFRTNEPLLKLRFIQTAPNREDLDEIVQRFKRWDAEDKRVLDSISFNFRAKSLNDSAWVRQNRVVASINAIAPEEADRLLKKTNFLQLRDSLGVYLIAVEETLGQNEQAPLTYVAPTIKEIILNKRKLQLISQLETDITRDAIKKNEFEIYN